MSEQWGKWVVHDGSGCPCVGMYVQALYENGDIDEAIAGSAGGYSWDWANDCLHIVSYRIRKPKGLTLLEEIAKNPERELEDV